MKSTKVRVDHNSDDPCHHWYFNGVLHREDGPAVEYDNGDTSWFQNGVLHREDGPAVEWNWTNKDKLLPVKEWYLYGKRLECNSQIEFEQLMRLKVFW